MLRGPALSDVQSDELFEILTTELDVATGAFAVGTLKNLRRHNFRSFWNSTAATDGSWMIQEDVHGPEEVPCAILLTLSEEGCFQVTLYPQEGHQVTWRQRAARKRAQARLNQLAELADAAPPSEVTPLGPRHRRSSLAERLAEVSA